MGANVGAGNWLKTQDSAMIIIDKLRNSSQFTLSTTLATADTHQYGPARIISISKNLYYRNVTLGQWDNHLNLRLRTPLTKNNGQRPELIVPNVFSDTKTHNLIVTYDGSLLAVYLDDIQHRHTIEFTPEAALFWFLAPTPRSTLHVNISNTKFYHLLYHVLIFLPSGIILYLITNIFKEKFSFH
ncbi:MAG: hypothetical protein F6K10_22545, partial [Moorea sp. SIO2B7]|nr:hypothetical protein [Moorena sp. SIO2B7]